MPAKPKPLSAQEFYDKANMRHGGKYRYRVVDVVNSRQKIEVICQKHGSFYQTVSNHLQGKGCSICKPQFPSKLTTDEFIIRARIIHGNTYNYSLVFYNSNKEKVKIKCGIHGIFEQEPRHHLIGQCCPACKGNQKLSLADFIHRVNVVHKNKYDYTRVELVSTKDKVIIICPTHSEFTQSVDSHLRGHGCPRCNDSKGEKIIEWYLTRIGVLYEKQKMFKGCKDVRILKFDFFIPHLNLCIEYDGIHHFKTIDHSGKKLYGGNKLADTQRKDRIKTDFCHNNDITLLRIAYDEDTIRKLEVVFEKGSGSSKEVKAMSLKIPILNEAEAEALIKG